MHIVIAGRSYRRRKNRKDAQAMWLGVSHPFFFRSIEGDVEGSGLELVAEYDGGVSAAGSESGCWPWGFLGGRGRVSLSGTFHWVRSQFRKSILGFVGMCGVRCVLGLRCDTLSG